MREHFNQELDGLRKRIAAMAEDVKQALRSAFTALRDADADLARRVCEHDRSINDQRFSMESDIVMVIATQQPVAGDLRLLIGILEIGSELERMGDYSKDIARIAIRQSTHGVPRLPKELAEMVGRAAQMLERATQAFVTTDDGLATSVADEDDQVDRFCQMLHRQLMAQAQSGELMLEESIRLLPVVHNVERFADRVTNVCERIVYIVTGKKVEFDDRPPE